MLRMPLHDAPPMGYKPPLHAYQEAKVCQQSGLFRPFLHQRCSPGDSSVLTQVLPPSPRPAGPLRGNTITILHAPRSPALNANKCTQPTGEIRQMTCLGSMQSLRANTLRGLAGFPLGAFALQKTVGKKAPGHSSPGSEQDAYSQGG